MISPSKSVIADQRFIDALVSWGWYYPADEINNPNRGQHCRMDERNRSHGGLLGRYDYYPDRKKRKIGSGIIVWFEMGERFDHKSGYIAELIAMPKALIGNAPHYYLSAQCWDEFDGPPPNNGNTHVTMYRIDFSDRGETQVNITIEQLVFGAQGTPPRPDATFKIDGGPLRSNPISHG